MLIIDKPLLTFNRNKCNLHVCLPSAGPDIGLTIFFTKIIVHIPPVKIGPDDGPNALNVGGKHERVHHRTNNSTI